MQLFYNPNITETATSFVFDKEESKHIIKVLRKKEGDILSRWTRAEVEYKSSDRDLPFDVLLYPSKYFVGSYPCFEWLAQEIREQFQTPEDRKSVV